MPNLILVRHGQASFGAADYDQLSERGVEQARLAAETLERQGVRPAVLAAGALRRQRDTAAPIAAAHGLDVEVDPRWDEYRMDEILTHHSDAPFRQHRDPGSEVPPISSREFQTILEDALRRWIDAGVQSPCEETWPDFRDRVNGALGDLNVRVGSGQVGVACTSGGVLAAVATILLGVPAHTFIALNRVAVNGAITRILSGRSGLNLLAYNEQAHLHAADAGVVTYR